MEALKPIWTVARSAGNSADGVGEEFDFESKGGDGPSREDEGRARAEAANPPCTVVESASAIGALTTRSTITSASARNEVPVSGLVLCSVALEVSMPRTGWMPSMVPYGADQTVYLVVDSFRSKGSVYRECEIERTNIETIIADFMSGQFNDPIRVVAFNTLEHWTEDAPKRSPTKSELAAISKAFPSRSTSATSSCATPADSDNPASPCVTPLPNRAQFGIALLFDCS